MPEEKDGQDRSGEPPPEALADAPIQMGGNKGIPPQPANNNSENDKEEPSNLAKEVRHAEKWLIGIGIATLLYYFASYYQTRSNFALEHRGYLVVDIATIHTVTQVLDVTVENPGRSIAEDVTVHANEATFDVNSLNGSVQNRFVNGWGEFTLPPIYPSSSKTTFNVPVPGLDMERVKSATQYIYVAIRITYTDEASGKKQSIPPVCMLSVPIEPAHDVQWKRCDPSVVIPQMEKWDENENPKYRWPSLP